jgi:hypothetical protein
MTRKTAAALFVIALFGFVARLARADVTITYKTSIKSAPIMPPEVQTQLASIVAQPQTMYVKGGKSSTTSHGITSIADLSQKTTTMIDASKKKYATGGTEDVQRAMVSVAPKPSDETLAALQNITSTFESKATGRMQTISGIEAEEHRLTLTMIQGKEGLQGGLERSGEMMRMVMEVWTPVPGQSTHLRALAEVERFTALHGTAMNPATMIQQMFPAYGDMAKTYQSLAKALDGKGVILRMHTSLYVPLLADIAQAFAAAGRPVPNFDPKGPMSEITMEMTALSTAPVQDSVFAIPAGFEQTTLEEIIKSQIPQLNGAK